MGALARFLCALGGGHEDIRRFDRDARKMYLQCVRCLRTTSGFSLDQSPSRARDTFARGIATRILTPASQLSMPRI